MKRKRISWAVAVLAGAVLAAAPAEPTTIDLGHPAVPAFLASNIGTNVDRSVVFDVLNPFNITSAGIRFDPSRVGASAIAVDIYQSQLGFGQTHGALLATASMSVTDTGMDFYDVPISFAFLAGQRYDVAFRSLDPDGWGFGRNTMEFYRYNYPAPAYQVGDVEVLDGGCEGCAGYGNSVMPHVRLKTAVPEPGTMVFLGAGIVLMGWVRRRSRR